MGSGDVPLDDLLQEAEILIRLIDVERRAALYFMEEEVRLSDERQTLG